MKRALLLALALAGCQSAAVKDVLRPPSLATTWIGLASDGLTWYRLDLDDAGTGTCAVTEGSATNLYRVSRWSDENEKLTVHLEIADGAPGAAGLLVLRGGSGTTRLDLVVEGRHSLTLWRERDLLDARKRLMDRMGARS